MKEKTNRHWALEDGKGGERERFSPRWIYTVSEDRRRKKEQQEPHLHPRCSDRKLNGMAIRRMLNQLLSRCLADWTGVGVCRASRLRRGVVSDAAVGAVDRRRASRRKAGISGQQKGQRDSKGIWLGSDTDASLVISEERGLRINSQQLFILPKFLPNVISTKYTPTSFFLSCRSAPLPRTASFSLLTRPCVKINFLCGGGESLWSTRADVGLVLASPFAGQQRRNLVCPFSSLHLSLLGTDSVGLACSLFGATVTSFKTADGTERLFVSSKSKLDGSKAVRSSNLFLATTVSMDRAA